MRASSGCSVVLDQFDDAIGWPCALLQPVIVSLAIKPERLFLAGCQRIEETDTLEVAAIARAAAVGDDNMVEGSLLGSATRQTNCDHANLSSAPCTAPFDGISSTAARGTGRPRIVRDTPVKNKAFSGPSTNEATAADKSWLRASSKTRRDTLPAEVRRAASARIRRRLFTLPFVRNARRVFVYISAASEVQTTELIDEFVRRGIDVLVPLLAGRETMHAVPFPGWDALQPGALGIPTPAAGTPPGEAPDCALLPGLAFTLGGVRLGYGGGYYDRWLAAHGPRHRVAIAFETQLVRQLPRTATDVTVPMICTEDRVIQVVDPEPGQKLDN